MTGTEHSGPPTTLIEKLHGVMAGEWRPFEGADDYPDISRKKAPSEEVADFAEGVKAWGIVYGIAFGMARAESPFESVGSVNARAHEAAREFFDAYNDGPLLAPWAADEGTVA